MVVCNQIEKLSEIAILDVFEVIPDHRRKQGRRHLLSLCLAWFTPTVVAAYHRFIAIEDWLKSYNQQLKKLFDTERLLSYSTIRRPLLNLDYEDYSHRLAQFFNISSDRGRNLSLI